MGCLCTVVLNSLYKVSLFKTALDAINASLFVAFPTAKKDKQEMGEVAFFSIILISVIIVVY